MIGDGSDRLDIALGVIATGARTGLAAARLGLLPARAALRAPVIGPPLRRRVDAVAFEGERLRARARVEMEAAAVVVLSSPDAERVVARVVATADLDRVVAAVLEHERTEQVIAGALASPGLERLVVRVLESRLVDEVTERVLQSPEMDRIVEYVATSPQVLDAIHQQTRSFADELATGVRRRAQSADDAAERTVRGWLRRPRPQPT